MKFGICYYPEHWPESRWQLDAQMMREAGLEIVRLAEFAWAKMEPVEDTYEWAWLDRAIETLAAADLKIVLATPTATPPAWLTQAHPDILRVDASGRSRAHGTRRHYCPNSPTYRHYSRKIVAALIRQYGHDRRIIGWQIDNEFGGGKTARCYCDRCAAAFRAWLRRRYGSLDSLNEAWGTIFWSQTYGDWSQIQPPGDDIDRKNPSQVLDFYRFSSDSVVSYQQEQIDLLRQAAPGQFVTTNFMGLFRDLNQFDLAAPLDFATWDNYPTGNPERWRPLLYPPYSDTGRNDPIYTYDVGDPIVTGMAHALTRGLKNKPFWIMEQQCGHINWGSINPGVRPGTPRLWAWHALVEGADTIVYFRWRAARYAHEQYHSGLLSHDGEPDVGYTDQLAMQAERETMAHIAAEPFTAQVALLFDFDDLWALQLQPHRADFDYLRHLYVYYHALQRLAIPVDLVSSRADLSPYRLVIAPTAHLVDEQLAAKLTEFAHPGGIVLFGVRSGFKTPSNLVTDQALPGLLRELVGATVKNWQSLPGDVGFEIDANIPDLQGPAAYWLEALLPESAEALARCTATGRAALTMNVVGEGRVFYLGWYPSEAQARALLTHVANQQAGIPRLADLPPGLIAGQRGPYTILLNFTDQPLKATVGDEPVTVGPRDVTISRRGAA